MSEINKFYSLMQSKPLRYTNQFQVTLAMTGVDGLDDIIRFYAGGAKLPGTTIEEVAVSFQGFEFKLPGKMSYDGTIDFDVKLDSDMVIWDKLMEWQRQFGSLQHGGGGFKQIPAAKVTLDLLDTELNNVVRTYELHGCWPTSIGEIEFTHEGSDLCTCSVGLIYQYFDEIGGNGIG